MKATRQKFVADFGRFVKERSAAGITKGEIVLRIDDWEGTIHRYCNDQKELAALGPMFDSVAFKGTVQDIWKEIEDLCDKWAMKGARPTWSSAKSSKSIKGSLIVIELEGNIKFHKGPYKGQKGKYLPTTSWMQNAINSFRKGVNTKLASRLKKFDGTLLKITAEHGVRTEGDGGQAHPQTEGLPGAPRMPGGQGNNVHTALVKALKLAANNIAGDLLTHTVIDFLNYTFDTQLDYRKNKNTIQRDHTIRLVMIPDSTQHGASDKALVKATKDFFKPGGDFDSLVKSWVEKNLTSLEDIDRFMSNSPGYSEELTNESIKAVLSEILGVTKGRPDMRLKVNKRMAERIKNAAKTTKASVYTQAGNVRSSVKREAFGKTGSARIKGRGAKSKTAASPIALRNLLNELLPEMVAQNMGSPALNFRTGRFANSTRVENVLIGPRGGINIDYTYMRNPYETFEPGGKQGSVRRDPRKLIGKSIRELSIQILGKQPTTLRRT